MVTKQKLERSACVEHDLLSKNTKQNISNYKRKNKKNEKEETALIDYDLVALNQISYQSKKDMQMCTGISIAVIIFVGFVSHHIHNLLFYHN